MLAKNHLAFALFSLCAFVFILDIPLTYATVLLASIGALLPDIDTPKSYIGRAARPLSTWFYAKYGHRTITHSLVFLASIALITYPFHAYAKHMLAFFIGISSHLFLDACTVKGSALAWPSSRPFHILPRHLLLKDTKPENLIFAGFMVLNVILIGAYSYGFASYQVVPSFDNIALEYLNNCDGEYAQKLCIVSAKVCDDYCGTIKGPALGFYNNKLVIKDKVRGYDLVDYYSQSLELEKVDSAPLHMKRVEFLDEMLTFEGLSGLTSVSGILYGDIECENPYKMYPVFNLANSHLEVHHILLEDLRERNCSGIVWEGYLEYKIRTFR